MWDEFIIFFSFSDTGVRNVTLGAVLLTATAAVVGSFTLLKKKALVGDAVAHAVLPGVCLSFLLAGEKNPVYLLIGAFITGWISLVVIDYIKAHSKIKEDTAIGLVLSVFFGIGIFLLTIIQKSGNAAQSGLDAFLFGQAASLVQGDLIVFGVTAFVLLTATVFLFKEFTILAFDANFASTLGLPVRAIELLLTTLTVLAVVIGIQAVGVVLMAAMLITPPAAARFWTSDVKRMVILSAVFGAISGLIGTYISFVVPSMPTGPWIVVVISIIALVAFLFAPGKGILYRQVRNYRIRKGMEDENILKALYQIGESEGKFDLVYDQNMILARRKFEKDTLDRALVRLRRQGYLESENHGYRFTKDGLERGKRVVKLHRLWELYLTKYMGIAPDHVHEDAETIEHFLTPELETRLEALLDYPTEDPHQSRIPY